MNKVTWYKFVEDKKYKYELTEDVLFNVTRPLYFKGNVNSEYYNIHHWSKFRSCIRVKKGYRWDGVTSPKFLKKLLDRPKHRKAALLHDVLLQAIYDDKIIHINYLPQAHKMFKKQLLEDTNWVIANTLYIGLKFGHNIWHKYNS